MPKVIGLTGGIATGKSTVSELLTAFGFKVVDADIAARKAVAKGTKGLEQVRAALVIVLSLRKVKWIANM